MRVYLRAKCDVEAGKMVIGLSDSGRGYGSTAAVLSVPKDTVSKRHQVYRAFGSEVLLAMDGKQARCAYG